MDNRQFHKKFANHWVKISGMTPGIKKMLAEFDGEHAFAYIYIDHDQGLSLDFAQTFDLENGEIVRVKSPVSKGVRCLARFDQFINSEKIELASPEEIEQNELKLLIPLETLDNRQDLNEFRNETFFDQFRAPGYPDDVQILLPPRGDLKPELIWARVEAFDPENNLIHCYLLNQPSQKFGLGLGSELSVVPVKIEDEFYLMWEKPGPEAGAGPAKKPWWKVW